VVALDGALWWADSGVMCTDGGDDSDERVWTSPIWIEEPDTVDDDGDGLAEADGDCDDLDDAIHPDAEELANGIDDDCDGLVDEGSGQYDGDGDGYSPASGDFDDDDPATHPGAEEICDGVADNDCDGSDDPDDTDGDGDGWTPCEGDCDDGEIDVNPEAEEVCDLVVDNDCDGHADPWELDVDEDGFTPCEGDCDDRNHRVHPEAAELANELDDDCDGQIDEDVDGIGPGVSDCQCRQIPRGSSGTWMASLAMIAVLGARRRSRQQP